MTIIHNNSIVIDERPIYDAWKGGQLPALRQALQTDMNPNGVVCVSRWIAALLLIDIRNETEEEQEEVAITAELAELVGVTPAQLSALADVLDDIGALVYEWREDYPPSVALARVRGAA
jgi:hypothetical protein